MARVYRLAGALLAETGGSHYLVGNPKRPCRWSDVGFVDPGLIDATARPYVALTPSGAPRLQGPHLVVRLEGEALAQAVASRLLISRNGSVSERLWTLVVGDDDAREEIPAQWLLDMPESVWDVVRDAVLRCV
jgi:hypothetical protein